MGVREDLRMLMTSPATENSLSESTDPNGQLNVAFPMEKTLGYSAPLKMKQKAHIGIRHSLFGIRLFANV